MLNPMRIEEVSTNTGNIRYSAVGVGEPTVVCLHGLFGDPSNWYSIMEALSDRYAFFALQLPIGHCESRRLQDLHSISQLTDYVEQFFEVTAMRNAVICGNSLGGQIAIDFCLRNHERTLGLVLAGSAGLFERNVTKGKGLRLCRDLIREQGREVFYDPKHVTEELVEDVYTKLTDRQYRRFLLKVSKATRNRYMLDELADVDAPTKIIWGRNDSITPPFVAEEFREKLPRASLAFLDECGHAPPIEQPQEFAHMLDEFLQNLQVT